MRLLCNNSTYILCVFVFLACINGAADSDEPLENTPEAILNCIVDIIENGCPHSENHGLWGCASDYRKQLARHGDSAARLIVKEIEKYDKKRVKAFFISCLGDIEGPFTDRYLFDQCFNETSLSFNAINEIMRRDRNAIPFSIEIPEHELDVLLNPIRENKSSGGNIRLVALLKQNDVKTRIEPIIESFKQEIFNPTQLKPMHGVYLSPRVFLLSSYLQAFKFFGVEAQPYMLKLHEKAKKDGNNEYIKWTGIALGMTGAQSATNFLENLIYQEKDIYIKYVAIRAYGLSAKQEAIPLLETLLDDESVSEYGDNYAGPLKLIASAASSELSRLQDKREEKK